MSSAQGQVRVVAGHCSQGSSMGDRLVPGPGAALLGHMEVEAGSQMGVSPLPGGPGLALV